MRLSGKTTELTIWPTYWLAVQEQVGWRLRQGFDVGTFVVVDKECEAGRLRIYPPRLGHFGKLSVSEVFKSIDLDCGIWIWSYCNYRGLHTVLLQTVWQGVVISHRSICTLHSISSLNTKHVCSSLDTRIMFCYQRWPQQWYIIVYVQHGVQYICFTKMVCIDYVYEIVMISRIYVHSVLG